MKLTNDVMMNDVRSRVVAVHFPEDCAVLSGFSHWCSVLLPTNLNGLQEFVRDKTFHNLERFENYQELAPLYTNNEAGAHTVSSCWGNASIEGQAGTEVETRNERTNEYRWNTELAQEAECEREPAEVQHTFNITYSDSWNNCPTETKTTIRDTNISSCTPYELPPSNQVAVLPNSSGPQRQTISNLDHTDNQSTNKTNVFANGVPRVTLHVNVDDRLSLQQNQVPHDSNVHCASAPVRFSDIHSGVHVFVPPRNVSDIGSSCGSEVEDINNGYDSS